MRSPLVPLSWRVEVALFDASFATRSSVQEPEDHAPNLQGVGITAGRPLGLAAAVLGLMAATAVAAPGSPSRMSAGTGEGLRLVAEIPFQNGSHLETATIKNRDYAFVSDVTRGAEKLHVVDITSPEKPRIVSTIPCNGYQGNVQISHDKRTLLIGIDGPSTTTCMPPGQMGFVTIDISNPRQPKPVGYAQITRGSHSLAAHPKKPYVYNGDGFPEAPGEMQVWSIKNPAKPKLIRTLDTGAHSPHDLAFNRTGTMLATADAVTLHLIETSDPADPKILQTTQCPGCVHTHEARFTPDGKRLVVNDEYPSSACPGGFMYFYDVVETAGSYKLELTGMYTADDFVTNETGSPTTKCTPHVFDISSDGTKIAATWHEGGLKYLDISDTGGVTVGAQAAVPGGPKELGWYVNERGYTFAAKLHKGPYIYVVDANVGFQVFKIAAGAR